MGRTVAIGLQKFSDIIENQCFYVDKTLFIKEWWENQDAVTLITRPRRFGKTLTMSMLEQFFSVKYAGRCDLFEHLNIWKEEEYRKLQGTYPVISLSFANVKEPDFEQTRNRICRLIAEAYTDYQFLLQSEALTEKDKAFFESVGAEMPEEQATFALHKLSEFLYRYYGKPVIILLDEYDTPMQEAYVDGYWEELVAFTRSMFNATFKTNPYMGRAIMTGITRVSKESIFSDLNNLEVVTTTSNLYAECFGFTEKEVFNAMEECGYTDRENVKMWYDGFTFGDKQDIYNPWSILNYLKKGEFTTYWANTSSNSLVGKLIREGEAEIKTIMEDLLNGQILHTEIDEQIVFNQLDNQQNAIWSLLLASGYLKVIRYHLNPSIGRPEYDLALTNMEVRLMFEQMIDCWFKKSVPAYNQFVKALLLGDVKYMNRFMNQIALSTFSHFDTGNKPSEYAEPEKFYHGFVLGLMVDLRGRYAITSNRESGFGRYDVILEPLDCKDNAYIFEFKVHDPSDEDTLEDTVKSALLQIEEKKYESVLTAKGIPSDRIRKYGFAFQGKQVLIG